MQSQPTRNEHLTATITEMSNFTLLIIRKIYRKATNKDRRHYTIMTRWNVVFLIW